MVREIEITLSEIPVHNDTFKLDINVPSEFVHLYAALHVFREESGIFAQYIVIGATIEQTAINMLEYFTEFYSNYSFIEVVQSAPNAIKIIITAEEVETATLILPPPHITITHTTTQENPVDDVYLDGKILSRSPFFVEITPSAPFDAASMQLRIWRGNYTDDRPLAPTYNLSKLAVQAGQPKIIFDIHRLVNDFIKSDIIGFQGGPNIGATTTSTREAVFVEAIITASYLEESVGIATRRFIAFDGFGWHTELYNPQVTQKVLSSIDRHVIYGPEYPLFFQTLDLTSLVINGNNVPFTYNQNVSNQIIGRVNVLEFAAGSPNFTAVFTYGDEVVTHYFTRKTECRFPVMNCIFKNKFGVWQVFPFTKRTIDKLEGTAYDYQAYISSYGQYSLTSHVKKTFNPELRQPFTANTDYIPEQYNNLLPELLLSEFVYMQKDGGQALPVNIDRRSIQYKNKNFDKLIQYAIDFEYAYDLMNRVN